MTLPRPPAFPLREALDFGTTAFADAAEGFPQHYAHPIVGEGFVRRVTVEYPHLDYEEADWLRNAFRTMRGAAGTFFFNRAWIDGGSDSWVAAKFDVDSLEVPRTGRHYRATVPLRLAVDPTSG